MVGYSSAMVEAWSQAAIRSVERSARVVDAFAQPKQRPSYVPTGTTAFAYADQHMHPSFPAVFKASAEMFLPAGTPSSPAALNPFAASQDLAQAWMTLWMRQSTALGARNAFALWPSVLTLMTFGLPRDVALPLAEANAASVEAAEAANSAMKQVFSSYHGEGGHAAAHLMAPLMAFMTSVAMPGAQATLCPPGSSPYRRTSLN